MPVAARWNPADACFFVGYMNALLVFLMRVTTPGFCFAGCHPQFKAPLTQADIEPETFVDFAACAPKQESGCHGLKASSSANVWAICVPEMFVDSPRVCRSRGLL